ncbi:MAG: type II secretion system protein [Pirellula sp.]
MKNEPVTNVKSCVRLGFTLVELLMVIAIIGVMSGMFLVAYRGAQQEASTLKTRSTLQKISEILNARMDEYAAYPVALRTPAGSLLPSNVEPILSNGETVSALRERARLLLVRDLIRMEMPDHPDDIKWTDYWRGQKTPVVHLNDLRNSASESLNRPIPTGLRTRGAAGGQFYVKNALTGRARSLMNTIAIARNDGVHWDQFNANAELLYLIVADSELDGSNAIELFGPSEVGDTDDDGLHEFLDQLGQPIRWIRWPSGFASNARYYPDMLDPNLIDQSTGRMLIDSETYDRLGSDPGWNTAAPPGVGLAPLVISGGLDRAFGIRFREIDRYNNTPANPQTPIGNFAGRPSYSSAEAPWYSQFPTYGANDAFTDPWYPRGSGLSTTKQRMGEFLVPGDLPEPGYNLADPRHSLDNITNYDGTGVSL